MLLFDEPRNQLLSARSPDVEQRRVQHGDVHVPTMRGAEVELEESLETGSRPRAHVPPSRTEVDVRR